jgi:uncharacterized protein YjbI with pentapeptide repeats
MRDLTIALVAVTLTFTLDNRISARQEAAEERRAERQEILENLRFVRDRSADPSSFKPFQGINLHAADLHGLNLGCPDRESQSCARFRYANMVEINFQLADLSNADLAYADLSGADLSRALLPNVLLYSATLTNAVLVLTWLRGSNLDGTDLTGANLTSADLVEADLTRADLIGVDLYNANLTGANLSGANLTRAELNVGEIYPLGEPANMTRICYDEYTIWPRDYTPPDPPECESW